MSGLTSPLSAHGKRKAAHIGNPEQSIRVEDNANEAMLNTDEETESRRGDKNFKGKNKRGGYCFWSEADLAKLREACAEQKDQQNISCWKKIASSVPGKTGKQCR